MSVKAILDQLRYQIMVREQELSMMRKWLHDAEKECAAFDDRESIALLAAERLELASKQQIQEPEIIEPVPQLEPQDALRMAAEASFQDFVEKVMKVRIRPDEWRGIIGSQGE